MIGSRDELYSAAMGKPKKKIFDPPRPRTPNTVAAELPADYQFDPESSPTTATLANLLASGTTSAGRSSKGKYGGFYSGGDLDAAIRGSTFNLKENIAGQLESIANTRMTTLDSMRAKAAADASRKIYSNQYNFISPSAASAPATPGMTVAPGGFVDKYVNPLRQYSSQLANWYSEQAKPAEDYLATASQIENAPASELAATIATRQYGMNPNLALGKFGTLDAEYSNRQRDLLSMQNYGMPYQQYQDQQKALLDQQKLITNQNMTAMTTEIQTRTGLSAKRLSETTGQTVDQMYNTLNKQYDVDGQIYNGAGAVDEVLNLLDTDVNAAKRLVESLQASAGGQQIGLLLNAILKYYVSNPYKIETDITEAMP
jgi:hypothetical protein